MSQPSIFRRLAGLPGWLNRCQAGSRRRRLLVEVLERRELLAAIRGDESEAALFSGHWTVCNCPICTGQGLAPEAPLIGPAAAAGLGSPLTSLPQLRSNPTATAKLFLDFDGHFESSWSAHVNVTTPAFDTDGDATTFSSGELNAIGEIWQRVAEDYAPFNIDVTTIDPGTQANKVAAIIAIGGSSSDWYGQTAGGISFVGGFYNSMSNVGYAFSLTLGGTAKNIAEAAAHEAGHLFGLQHQSRWNGNTLIDQYHSGNGDWAPIMGVAYQAARSTWFNGATLFGPDVFQDDLAVIGGANNEFGWRSDDYANTPATAGVLPIAGNTVQVSGLIGQNDDQDVWSFNTIGGPASFQLVGAARGTNLDAVLELRNAAGQTLVLADPSGSYGATISTTLASGNYYLLARSSGIYGSLGQYTISGSVTRGPFPEITLAQGVIALADAQAFDFGATPLGMPITRVFTVGNEGTGPLTLSPLDPAGLPAGFAIEANLGQLTLTPGQSTTFTLRFTASGAGVFSGPVRLGNNDADENPFDLTLGGTVLVPDIAILLNNTPVADGQTLDLGSAIQGAPTTNTLTVLNQGTYDLQLTPLDPAGFPSGFSLVTNLGSSTLGPGQSTTFTIRVDAAAGGTFTGPLHLVSNDPDENPFVVTLTASVQAPEIEVQLAGADAQDGQTIDFGLTSQGQPVVRMFSVTNTGTAALTLTPLDPASMPVGYSIATNLGLTGLGPGQSTTFAVQLDALAGGNYGGTLHLASNDVDESPFNLVFSGRVFAPDIVVLTDGVSVVDGGTADFGTATLPIPISRTFTVRNDGLAPLTLTPLAAANLPAGFTLLSNLGLTTLAPAQSTTFTVRLDAAAPGLFGGPLQLVSNDADESPFDIVLTGRVIAPEITVKVNGASVEDGGLVHFGNALAGQPIDRTFTITNDGAAALMLAPLNAATLPAGFSLVTNIGSHSLAPGQSTSFTVRLAAVAAGSFGGTWVIANTDPDENPFDLQLAGTVTAPEIVIEADGIEIADGGGVDFETTTPGMGVIRRFTIRNHGDATLTLAPLNAATLPTGFALVANQGLTTLGFGQTTSFVVRFESTVIGDYGGSWSVLSNDNDESSFDLALTGRVAAAEIDVLLGGQSMADGQAVSFGTAAVGQPVTYEFVIFNRGNAPLDLVPLSPSNVPVGLTLTSNIAQTRLSPSQSTSFNLRLDAAAPGVFGGELALGNTDTDENPFNLTFSGTVIAPEIVAELAGGNVTSGQTIDFGVTSRGTAIHRTFVIRNIGSGNLSLGQLSAANMPAGFSLVNNLGQTALPSGQSTSFTVRLNASTAGTFGGVIQLSSNDADENPFRFVVSGRVNAPDIAIRVGAANISDGQTFDFGTTLLAQPVQRTFTVINEGQATLHLAPLSATNLPAGFSLASPLGTTALAPGQATSFALRLNAAAGGAIAGPLQLFSTDPDESPFDLMLTGNVLAPEIRLETGGSELASGDTIDLGGTVVGLSVDRTFTVQNVGTAALDLTPLDPAALPAGFAIVSNLPTTSLAPGNLAAFTLRLAATVSGTFAGAVNVASNDADESPFILTLVGSVSAPKIGLAIDGLPLVGGQTIDFGDSLLGAGLVRTFDVHNLGSAPLVVTPLNSTDLPPGFSIETNLPWTQLPPGAATTFAIRFDAASLGTFGGELILRSNDPAVDSFEIIMSARAVAPEIAVELDGVELTTGQTLDFGTAVQGQPIVRTLTVRNTGTAPLSLAPLQSGSLPAGFSLAANLDSMLLLPGQTTSLVLRFDAAGAGDFAGDMELASGDADDSPLRLMLAGRVLAPEIFVLVQGAEVPTGTTADFGVTPVGGSSSRTFTVRNDGDAPLTLQPLSPAALPAGYTLVSNLGTALLSPGAATTFTLRLGGAAAGSFAGQIELVNGDSDEARYAIRLHGVLSAPEIAIASDGVDLAAGQLFDWGDTLRGSAIVKTLTITNAGDAALNLTPLNPASLPPGFMLLSNIGATTLAPGASTSLSLRLDATMLGSFGGEIAIGSNDADENPFRLAVSARVIDPADVHVAINLPAGGGDYVLDNSAGRMRLSRGAETLFARTLTTVQSLTLHGTASGETLHVSSAQGSPLPAEGVRFEAGESPTGDLLSMQGTAAESIEWTAGDLAAGAGTLTAAGRWITYSGVESLDLTGMGQARLQFSGAPHGLMIGAGATSGSGLPALVVQGTAGSQPLPAIALRDNAAVAIASSTSAADAVTMTGAANDHQNRNLNIDTGEIAGDRIDVTGSAVFTGAVSLASRQILFPHVSGSIAASLVVLTASEDITDSSPDVPSILGSELIATAAGGIALGTASPLVRAHVTGPGLIDLHSADDVILADVRTADGDIRVESMGAISIGIVDAGIGGLGNVSLTAAYSIVPFGIGTPQVRAASLALNAGAEVGTSEDPLKIAAFSLADSAAGGGIHIAALGNLQASAVAAGEVSISAAGHLVISGGVTSNSSNALKLTAGGDLTIAAGATVAALGDVHLAFGQGSVPAATATLAGQIVSLTGAVVSGGTTADRFIVRSSRIFVAPQVALLGQGGSDAFSLEPQAQARVIVRGGSAPGGATGDVLELDLSASAADPAGTAIVSAAHAGKGTPGRGIATAPGYGEVDFGELDGFALRDQGVITGVALGGLYIRGTQDSDIIEVGRTATAPYVQVRVNDQLLTLPVTTRTLVVGRGGNDALGQTGVGLPVELRGDAGDDNLTGDSAGDILIGGEGRDTLTGLAGDDYLLGDGGDDTLYGGAGNDRIYGGLGRDTLYGDEGHDVLAAGDSRDQLHGGSGRDVLIGGLSADMLSGDNDDDLLITGRVNASSGSTATTGYRDAYDLAMAAMLDDWSADGRLDSLLEILSDSSSNTAYGGEGTDAASVGVGDTGDWERLL